jgi:hypothetical protein
MKGKYPIKRRYGNRRSPFMGKNIRSATAVLIGFFLILMGAFGVAVAGEHQHQGSSQSACPHEQTKQISGSKIVFETDSHDFGQIPYNRTVTHLFGFRNAGTAPLLLASHIKSKPIEGC